MSGSTNQLDISNVDSENHEELASRIENFYRSDAAPKQQLAWGWERNHLFLDGKHWIVYDGNEKTGGVWRKLEVSAANEYIPRPTTNYVFSDFQTLKGYLIKNKPRSTVSPNTQTNRDKQAAKIATLCCEANWTRLKEDYNYEYAAACLVPYGTVFKKDYWDTTALQKARIPRMEPAPQMDPATGQQTGVTERQAKDPTTGELLFDEIPLGDVNTAIVEPYRITLDPLATDLHNARWVMESSIQTVDWVMQMFDKQDEGYTGLASQVKPEKNLSGPLRRFYQLKNSSGMRGGGGLEGSGGSDQMAENSVVVKEVYEQPSGKYPKGRMIVVASGKTLYAHNSPYDGPELGDWHPYSECRWELVPGRFWGKSALDEAVEQNKIINSIDSVIVLTRKTMAVPQKLLPNGCGVPPGQWTGRPGQEISYRDLGTGAKPETIPGVGVDASVFQEREMRRESMKECTGAVDILKGDRPPGVTAASALNMLYEVGTGKLFPVLDRWKRFVESSQKKQLKLIARKYREPRPDYIKLLQAKNTELSPEAIDKFLGEDLYDNCNVVVEAGSNIPKLQAAKQALLMELAQAGVLNLEIPGNRMEFQRQMGIQGFDNDVGPDTKRAEWENDLLENIGNSPDNQPVILASDNHDIHLEVLRRRMKMPNFLSLPPDVQAAFTNHEAQHQQMKDQLEQAQMMQQMAAGGGAPSPQGPAPQQGSNKSFGKGVSKEVKNAMLGDALTPASLGQGSRT
jgi:hypothetical protein